MRGTSSIANAVTPAVAQGAHAVRLGRTARKPIVTAPGRSRATWPGSSGRTCSTTSAPRQHVAATHLGTGVAVVVVAGEQAPARAGLDHTSWP